MKTIFLSIFEFIAKQALKFGLGYLEKQYPGVSAIIDKIISWLEAAQGGSEGNSLAAVSVLDAHVDSLPAFNSSQLVKE